MAKGPDYRAVIRAEARRDKARFVVDGMAAANNLGLTTTVPARIEVLIDTGLKSIALGKWQVHFKNVAPRRLYWADRPTMRVVLALYRLQDVLANEEERAQNTAVLQRLLADPAHGPAIREDLRDGLSTLPIWMKRFVRPLVLEKAEPA